MSSDLRWILASDLHFPKHEPRYIDLLFQVIKKWKPHAIDLPGDIDDAEGTSRWASGSVDEVNNSVVRDSHVLRQFSADLRAAAMKSTDIHWHDGNHGWTRHSQYIKTKAKALDGLITPDMLYDLKKNGIKWHSYQDPPVRRFGNLYVHHGESINQHSGQSVKKDIEKFGVSLIRGHCFSDDTEILTPSGWKGYKEIEAGSAVMTLNKDTNVLEYNSVEEKFVYDDFDELIRVKAHGLDLMVTKGHGLLHKSRSGVLGWAESSAGEIYGKSNFIPLAGLHDDIGIDATDAEVRLLAWIMAEGNFDYKPNGKFSVRLSQSDAPDGRLNLIKKDVEEAGFCANWIKRYTGGETEHGTYRNFDAYRAHLTNSKVYPLVTKFFDHEKNPLDSLRRMNLRQISIFLDRYIIADGCKNSDAKNSYQIATANSKHRDFLQELAVRSGYRTSVCEMNKEGIRVGWYITMNSRMGVKVSNSSWSRVPYRGKVWCVSVPNGTVVVRRNGRTAITLNSHRMGMYCKSIVFADSGEVKQDLVGYEIGHLCDVTQMKYSSVHDWQPGFAIGHVVDGIPHIQLIRIQDYTAVVDGITFRA